MNENIFMDAHEELLNKLNELSTKIEAQSPNSTPLQKELNAIGTILTSLKTATDSHLSKIDEQIAAIRLPKPDNTELIKIANHMRQSVLQCSENITSEQSQINQIIEQVKKPIIKQKIFTFDITSKNGFATILLAMFALIFLSLTTYRLSIPNHTQQDNDLKYRYIKMKGSATPETISELENIFELNRNNAKIRQIQKDVEIFEEAVHKKALLDEQTRLKQLESEKLGEQANEMKQK